MKYVYQLNGKDVEVFVSEHESDPEVTIRIDDKSHDGMLQQDSNGKFFTFKKKKIYLNDLIPFTYQEFKEKIKKGTIITPLELLQAMRDISFVGLVSDKEDTTLYLRKCESNSLTDEFELITKTKEKKEEKKNLTSYNLAFLINNGLLELTI